MYPLHALQVAGNETGVTAFQMDIKVTGITMEVMRTALEQAKAGRIHILSKPLPRSEGQYCAVQYSAVQCDRVEFKNSTGEGSLYNPEQQSRLPLGLPFLLIPAQTQGCEASTPLRLFTVHPRHACTEL